MNRKLILITLILLIFSISLSACGSAAGAASSWPGLFADEETAYVAFNQHVYAVNLSNGNLKWRFPNEAEKNTSFFAKPATTSDGQLIVADYNNVLYSLNPANGTMNWSFEDGGDRYVGSPLVTEDRIYAPNTGGTLICLDYQGNLVWNFKTDSALWAQPVIGHQQSNIFLSSMDHHVYSINTDDGSLKWKTDDLGGAIVGSPSLNEDGLLFIGTFANEILALNTSNGKIVWRTPTQGWVWAGLKHDGVNLYVGDLSGTFYAVDPSNGNIQWQIQPDGPITESSIITNEYIYFSTEAGSLYSVNKDGNPNWNIAVGSKMYTAPALSDDILLVTPSDSDQLLIALDIDGKQKWTFQPEK